MLEQKTDWLLEEDSRTFVLDDYYNCVPRWCPGCGDHAVLNSIQRLCRDKQLVPEQTVFVSGIGCSSRFPHYMKTYGFHGLHGRAFPVACGVRSRRPDLNIFVATGDGDCCSIGTAHWIHALRYNMKMAVMLFDNNIYGLTKMQTSPTTPIGQKSNTHPMGAVIPPLNPISISLGVSNASFIAQTVDWNPPHLYATLKAAHEHDGFALVRIMQRCPHFTPDMFTAYQNDPSNVLYMKHENGIDGGAALDKIFKNQVVHDPSDRAEAFQIAETDGKIPIGLFYLNKDAARYDYLSAEGMDLSNSDKLTAMDKELDKFLV